MIFVDSHAHLADPAFDNDRAEVVARARREGAAALVCIGESLPAADRARSIARQFPGFVYWTAGVHPHDAADFDELSHIPAIRAHVESGAVAVGECGLDYHYDHSPRDRQLAAFAAQIDLARSTGKPVVVHAREAEDDMRAMLADAGRAGVTGVMHCFTGTELLARTALDCGWSISFSGIVTFRKWVNLDLLRMVPEDRLLAESDSPYLAPVPHRGKRNEPAWVPLTIARLAMARAVDPELLSAKLTDNARAFFGLAMA
ncbi:MAG: TatD family hydrolase [Anaerolineae bacterium]|nr:TatD family hydrolase [Gemmatimonadaceae bacterium]